MKTAKEYKKVYSDVKKYTGKVDEKFGNNQYYQYCYQKYYRDGVVKNETLKNIQEYTNVNMIKRILLAYKLFYVGCSRAKENLTVFVQEKKIEGYKNEFIRTFEEMGFAVESF